MFIKKLENLIKVKYNKNIIDLNCKSIMNIVRHNNLINELYEETDTQNMGEGLYLLLNNIKDKPKCYCGNNVNFINFTLGYHKYCSTKCMTNSETVINKKIEVSLKKYGTKYSLQNKDIQNKRKATCIEKYGVDNPSKNKEIIRKLQLKSKITFKENFYKQLINGTRLLNKVEPLFKLDEYSDIHKRYKWLCLECNTEFEDNLASGKIPYCPECNKKYHSKFEKEISNFLESLNIKFIQNDRQLIKPFELDFVIPKHKIAIEFDGVYWHSENINSDKNYHLNKTIDCKEQEYQLIHIFEDEWKTKQEIVKSILKSKLGIYDFKIGARKCILKELTYKDIKKFIKENHIQGSVYSSINIGLFYQDELVQVCTFSKSRFNKKYDYELLRFCSKLNTQVIGGLSKCISYFKKNYSGTLISYADKRYSDGLGYLSSGFKLVGNSKLNYWYILNGNRYSRIQFQKHKLSKLLSSFNPSLTEWENMQLNGYNRIWDCGNLIFEI